MIFRRGVVLALVALIAAVGAQPAQALPEEEERVKIIIARPPSAVPSKKLPATLIEADKSLVERIRERIRKFVGETGSSQLLKLTNAQVWSVPRSKVAIASVAGR